MIHMYIVIWGKYPIYSTCAPDPLPPFHTYPYSLDKGKCSLSKSPCFWGAQVSHFQQMRSKQKVTVRPLGKLSPR